MIEPIDIALEVHKICEEELIPKNISPAHDITRHSVTTTVYAKAVNGAGLHVTGKEVTEAIIEAAAWDRDSKWPGHPRPDLVVEVLRAHQKDKT